MWIPGDDGKTGTRLKNGSGGKAMPHSVAKWREALPWIDWETPVEVRLPEGVRYVCRMCIAEYGLRTDRAAAAWPTNPDDLIEHIRKDHEG